MKIQTASRYLLAGLAPVLISACAAAPQPPSDAFQAADIAIANAESEKASEYAPAELQSAHDKIREARAAIGKDPKDEDVMKARRLADEAQADAELASARERDGRAEAVNAELQKNIDTLRIELQRNAGSNS